MSILRRMLVLGALAGTALLAGSGAGGRVLAVPAPIETAAGNDHSCALLSSGKVMCWGTGDFGVLGNGSTAGSYTPVAVSGISGAQAIAAGNFFNCALVSGGAVKCWGQNTYGQLGNGSTADSSTPVSVSGISGAQAIATGLSTACALLSGGTVKCWGYGDDGELGNGIENPVNPTPVDVLGLSGASAIAVGGYHACAVVSGGVKCWGRNVEGQVGNGSTIGIDVLTPTSVVQLSGTVQALGAGDLHTCATVGGATKCWGDNSSGQLGNGTKTTDSNPTPVAVSGSTSFAGLAGGSDFTCGRTAGKIRCWGENRSGELGDGKFADRTTPTDVVDISGQMRWVATGQAHACGIVGKLVECWGENGSGQLGEGGGDVGSSVPVIVNGLGGEVLEVSKVGTGSGMVKSAPSGINCGSTCAAVLAKGGSVTLTAAPANGSLFSGWGGDCSGTGDCKVKMSKERSVTTGFDRVKAPPAFKDDFQKKGDEAPHAFVLKSKVATVVCRWKSNRNTFDLKGFSYVVAGKGKITVKKSVKRTSVTVKVTPSKAGGVLRFVVVAKTLSRPAKVTTTVKR